MGEEQEPMVRVELGRMYAGPRGTYPAGTVIEVPVSEAKALVANADARTVDLIEETAEAAPEGETRQAASKKKAAAKKK